MSAMTVPVPHVPVPHVPVPHVPVPHVSIPHAHPSVDQPRPRAASTRPCKLVPEATAPSEWRLTDRGIAVVMVVAVVILTAALAVIGLTAARVTSADYIGDVHTSQVDQR